MNEDIGFPYCGSTQLPGWTGVEAVPLAHGLAKRQNFVTKPGEEIAPCLELAVVRR
jgi:hypothetical protein